MGALFAAFSVAMGAFGAHALKSKLSPIHLTTFETASRYLMYHALALILCAVIAHYSPSKWLTSAGLCFMAGCILFPGSLWGITLANLRMLGPVTPLGGLLWIAGWLSLMIHFINH